jgi:hypothetical protein
MALACPTTSSPSQARRSLSFLGSNRTTGQLPERSLFDAPLHRKRRGPRSTMGVGADAVLTQAVGADVDLTQAADFD